MLFSNIGIINSSFQYQPHMWVGTKGARIAYIESSVPRDAAEFGEEYPGENKLLMPGLYNAHSHAPMTLLRGWGEGLPLQRWLNERIFPFEAKMTAQDTYWGTLLGIAEMLRYGVVSFSDMYYCGAQRFQACAETGIKINLGESLVCFDEIPYQKTSLYETNKQLMQEWHGAEDGRLLLDFNLHAEYTSNAKVARGLAETAAEAGVRMQVHVSETAAEVNECKQRHGGLSPVAYLESVGIFDVPANAAHCVWLEDEDYAILRERCVSVSTNPASNAKLGSGFANVPRLLDAGIAVALGTDGAASNNNLDMFQDLYTLALTATGASQNPTVLPPEKALEIATRNGALSQGRDDCGLITEGMRADLCVLDTSGPSWVPCTNMVANVVYAGHGGDVCLTMVDGRVLYREGQWLTLDIEKVRAEASAATARITAEL